MSDGVENELISLRDEIERADWHIAIAIEQRQVLSEAIGLVKSALGKPIRDKKQQMEKREFYRKRLGSLGEQIYDLIHEDSIRRQK